MRVLCLVLIRFQGGRNSCMGGRGEQCGLHIPACGALFFNSCLDDSGICSSSGGSPAGKKKDTFLGHVALAFPGAEDVPPACLFKCSGLCGARLSRGGCVGPFARTMVRCWLEAGRVGRLRFFSALDSARRTAPLSVALVRSCSCGPACAVERRIIPRLSK